LVVGLVEIAGDGDQVQLQLLQVEFTTHLFGYRLALDDQAVRHVDLHHGRLVDDHGARVVFKDGLDDAAGVVVLLECDECVGHATSFTG